MSSDSFALNTKGLGFKLRVPECEFLDCAGLLLDGGIGSSLGAAVRVPLEGVPQRLARPPHPLLVVVPAGHCWHGGARPRMLPLGSGSVPEGILRVVGDVRGRRGRRRFR